MTPRGARRRVPLAATARLLRLELRRNAMLWLLPLAVALFWLITYRKSMSLPPLWNVRAMSLQNTAGAAFVPTVVGAAAWMGSREGRHGISDLVVGTARPRWARQLAAWAATTVWALVAYLACVAVLYAATARQATWGGPLWWPALVGAVSLPAVSALGFAAGALRPSRFTTPLVAVAAFLALELSAQLIHGDNSYWQIAPLVAGPWNLGPNEGVATFYRYLPDLPIIQTVFLVGLTAALLGVLGLSGGAGGKGLRRSAAAITAVGLLAAGTAVALAGTGRLDAHGMIAIPAVHDAADDLPVAYTPVCGGTAIPVCLHPAYTVYLTGVVAALEPVLREVAGLPGAPVRVSQVAATYEQGSVDGGITVAGPRLSGSPPVFQLLLPNQLGARTMTPDELAADVRANTARDIVDTVIGGGRQPTAAQDAIRAAMSHTSASTPATEAAAQRFAVLSPAARHAWLMQHVAELRAGQITLVQLP
jgi:hypothetical protein